MADCILFATADWRAPYWTNKQHTAMHLTQAGFRVLYVESIGLRAPGINTKDVKRLWQRLIRGINRPQEVAKNVWVLSPLIIPFKHHWRIVRKINRYLLRRQLKQFIKTAAFKEPHVWTYHPFMLEAIEDIPHAKIVYHNVDDLAAVPGIDAVAFNAEEEKLLKKVDTVFTTSEALFTRCQSFNPNTYHYPNVADATHFGKALQSQYIPDDLAVIPMPRIGFVGALSDYKVDFNLILSIAKQHPEWHWVFIGEEREGQENAVVATLRTLPNVHFLGYRAYAKLPDYLRGFNVATLPTLINDYTRSMFPMKYFEYLAAGLPIVSTPLDFTRTHVSGMVIADNPDDFACGIATQLERGKLTADEIKTFIADNTWEIRLQKMLDNAGMAS